jgi:hypothetical protein
MRKIVIDIDAKEQTCGECEYNYSIQAGWLCGTNTAPMDGRCTLFHKKLSTVCDEGEIVDERCQECLDRDRTPR